MLVVLQTMNTLEYNKSVDLYADRVYRFIVKNLKHNEDARDVVQNAFEKLWRNREKVPIKKARSYLFTVAYHNMIDHIRKNSRIDSVEHLPERLELSGTANFELKETLNYGLAQLTDKQRAVILLRDYEGYAYKEIAVIMGLSNAQVKINIYRARKKLQEFLISIETVL